MIIKEHYMTRYDGVELAISFSDQGKQIVRDDVSYDEAIDPADAGREYTEGRVLALDPWAAVDYWVRKVQTGEWEIADVPANLQERVKKAIAELPLPEGEISDTEALNIILGKE